MVRLGTPDGLFDALAGPRRVLLTGPVETDGDSIGACLALQRILRARGLVVDVQGEPSYRYAWMPGAAEMLADAAITPTYDAVVVMDGDRHRLPRRTGAAFAAAKIKGIVDHHASTTPDGYDALWLDAEATSTCEMVYGAALGWNLPIDRELAELLYVGAIFDTGAFRYSNTTPATHRMAAALLETGLDHAQICIQILMERRVSGIRVAGRVFTEARFARHGDIAIGDISLALANEVGLVSGDIEGVVDSLLYTCGVEVAILLIERADGKTKVSFRSRGLVNVAKVAKAIAVSGGGHAKAAGALLDEGPAAAEVLCVAAIGAAIDLARAR